MDKFVFQWSESNSCLISYAWAEAFVKTGQLIGKDLDALGVVQQRVFTSYITEENIARSAEFASRCTELEFQNNFLAMTRAASDNFISLFSNVHSQDLSKLSNNQLAELLEQYNICLVDSMVPFLMLQAEFTDLPCGIVKDELKKAGVRDVEAAAALLFMPDKLDIIKREELALAKLSKNQPQEGLAKHAYDYAVLFYNSYDERQNVEFLKSRLASSSPFSELEKEFNAELKERKIRQKELEAKLDAKTCRLAWFLREIAFERLELKDKWAGAEFRFASLFKEIARRMATSLADIFYVYSIPELITFLRSGSHLDAAEVAQRKYLYLVMAKNGILSLASGEAARKLVEKLVPQHFNQQSISEIRGAIANPGKVTGKARVVLVVGITELLQDMELFQKGEILITTMTQPNMVPLIKKASAVVADEGGMTSHAAVLSREFGVPCIVGTHVATKVIKTGDLIEVDASRGIVKKL